MQEMRKLVDGVDLCDDSSLVEESLCEPDGIEMSLLNAGGFM